MVDPIVRAREHGFNTISKLDPEIINGLEKLIDRGAFDWQIVGEKIDQKGNPIWLLYDEHTENFAHAFIAKAGGFVTYMGCIGWQSWC